MIEVIIKTNGEKVLDRLNNQHCTLSEVAIVLYRLEQIKLKLLSMEFKPDFQMEEK